MRPLLFIALRNVVRNRRRSLITLAAIFFALTVMTGIRGFLNGLQAAVGESVILGQTGALQIHRKGYLNALSGSLQLDFNAGEVIKKVTGIPGVKAAAARIAFGAVVNANDRTSFAMFTAVDPVQELSVCPQRSDMISSGKGLSQIGASGAILVPDVPTSVGTKLDGPLTLLTGDRDGVLNAADVQYTGAYGQPGLPLPDRKLGFVPLAFAQDLLRMPGQATEIAVALVPGHSLDATKSALQGALGAGYEVSTWHEVAPFLDDMMQNQDFVLNLVAVIFLIVALLGVANAMLMSVFERTREIGTMMSVGVRRRQILGLFLFESAFLGLLGGIVGACLGSGIVAALGREGLRLALPGATPMRVFPFLTVGYVGMALAAASGGAALASLWPALRASRLRPIDALGAI